MGKHYTLYDQDHVGGSHERPGLSRSLKNSLRRVWVKRLTGTPTTIMVGPDQLIDDLKQAVVNKFPNSLARHFDPAEIQILVRVSGRENTTSGRRTNKKKPARNPALSSEDVAKSSQEWQDQDSVVALAPDQIVWDVINEYWGGAMSIEDAFIVDADANETMPPVPPIRRGLEDPYPPYFEQDANKLAEKLPLLQLRLTDARSPSSAPEQLYHHPRPQYPAGNNHLKNKTLLASPNFGTRMGLLVFSTSTVPGKHSTIIPSSSPGPYNQPNKLLTSQPVLLLPKNFSLGDQNGQKPAPFDEHKSNVSNVGIKQSRSSSHETSHKPHPHDLEKSTLMSKRISEGNGSTNSSADGHPQDQLLKAIPLSASSSKNHVTGSVTRSLDAKSSKLKNKTPLSTFEKVLPLISVLVVEDNSINQAILGAFLRKHKIHYHIAKNGQEAVDKWRKGGFHLVLMDIQLPVKSGIEATKEIRNLEKINRIGVFAQHELVGAVGGQGQEELTDDQKLDLDLFRSPVIIVALTASSNSSVDKKNALTAGCNDFLTKPVNLVWLQNKITEWGCMQALIDFDGWKDKRTLTLGSSGKDVKAGK
ncbi:hypothetical protein PUMCH_000795 [Australozyma saopauloensis]|uniref:Response regulatory domain-containing protein n=1 Tax=Australozyma saopauloensis TaxID=291208 RepID=A0AAX4H4X4_9ASCO|nr:hypothetical protein PUMCH_000795 [[Candida] saopauloensis]